MHFLTSTECSCQVVHPKLSDRDLQNPSLLNFNCNSNTWFFDRGIKTQALRLKNDGIPVYGLGLEGHFYTHDIDMDVLKVIYLHFWFCRHWCTFKQEHTGIFLTIHNLPVKGLSGRGLYKTVFVSFKRRSFQRNKRVEIPKFKR